MSVNIRFQGFLLTPHSIITFNSPNCICFGGLFIWGDKVHDNGQLCSLFFPPSSLNCSEKQEWNCKNTFICLRQPSSFWIINAPGFMCLASLSLGPVDSGHLESRFLEWWICESRRHPSYIQRRFAFRGCWLNGPNISSVTEINNHIKSCCRICT